MMLLCFSFNISNKSSHTKGNQSLQSLLFFILLLSLAGNSGHLTWVRLQQPQEQRYPFLTVHAVFTCVQTKVWLPVLGIFNVWTDVHAHDCTWECTNTVRESTLKVNSGIKIPRCTRESNLLQQRASLTLYQLLSYIPALISIWGSVLGHSKAHCSFEKTEVTHHTPAIGLYEDENDCNDHK